MINSCQYTVVNSSLTIFRTEQKWWSLRRIERDLDGLLVAFDSKSFDAKNAVEMDWSVDIINQLLCLLSVGVFLQPAWTFA